MKTCKDCAFFKLPVEHEGVKYGFCFRYPPTVIDVSKSQSPVLKAEMPSCGEFKRKWFRK